jgi:hypothetical protein
VQTKNISDIWPKGYYISPLTTSPINSAKTKCMPAQQNSIFPDI